MSLLLVAAGCVTEVAPGRARTTAPLRLATRITSQTVTAREQVGSVQYTNGAGQNAGTAAVYANRTYSESRLLWRPYQGDQPIADEDFFRFVGDDAAAAASHSYRRTGHWLVRIGLGATLIGSVVCVAGLAVKNFNLTIAGAAGVAIGPSVAYFGYAYLNPEAHAVPYSRAAQALEPDAVESTIGPRTIPIPVAVSGEW